jgi:predicted PurR-regulated permease PerM
MMKRLAVMAAVALATLAAVLALWQFRGVVIVFVLSLALAAALRPLVERQVARGWPRPTALLAVYGLALALFFVILWSIGGPLLDELRLAVDRFVFAYEQTYLRWPNGEDWQQTVVRWLPAPEALVLAITGPEAAATLQNLLGLTAGLLDYLSQAAIVLVLSLYWGMDQARFERLWLSVLPPETRQRAREVWRAVETGVGSYVRSEATQSLLAGVLLGIGYALIGLPYPTLLALVSAIAWLVPWLGAALALVPVLALGWAEGPGVAFVAAVYTALVFMVLEFLVEPRLHNRRQYNALLVVLLLLMLGDAYGLPGILAAPPLAAALQILLTHLLQPASTPAAQGLDEQFQALEARLDAVRLEAQQQSGASAPQVQSLVERLEDLLGQAGTALRDEGQLTPGRLADAARAAKPAAENTPQARRAA